MSDHNFLIQAVHPTVIQESAAANVKSHLAVVDICEKAAQQLGTGSAAYGCLQMLWHLCTSLIDHWLHRPKVYAALCDDFQMRNAAFPRSTVIIEHYKGLVRS